MLESMRKDILSSDAIWIIENSNFVQTSIMCFESREQDVPGVV